MSVLAATSPASSSYASASPICPIAARHALTLPPGLRTLSMERRVLIAYRVSDDEVTILRVLYAGSDFTAEDVPH